MNTTNETIVLKAVKAAIEAVGTQTAVVRKFGFKSGQSVPNWILRNRVPGDHVIKLCEMGGWVVTPHELRPDIYPDPSYGLPANNNTPGV